MTEKRVSIGELCEAFWEIEQKEDLYNWEVMGVKLWPLVRFRVFYNLTKNADMYKWKSQVFELPDWVPVWEGKPGYKVLWQYTHGWRWALRKVIPDAWKDPRAVKWLKAEAMVSPFSNRSPDGIDYHSLPVLEALGDKAIRLGMGGWDAKRDFPHFATLQREMRRWHYVWSIIVRLGVKKADYEKYQRVIRFLEDFTGSTTAPYNIFPRWAVRNYLMDGRGWRSIFKRIGIKRLYIVNAARMNMQGAMQDAGGRVIELQNGVFSKYNLQFSWPGRPNIPYIPDEIWTWGEFWTDGIDNSGLQSIVVAGANPEFSRIRELAFSGAEGYARKPKSMVVMSQPLIGVELFRSAIKLAKSLPNYEIVFKSHPKDQPEEFDAVVAELGQPPKNFSFAPEGVGSLQLIAQSEICLGVFSATLIEAAGLRCKVAILKLAGWEHLGRLIDGGHAAGFDNVEQLIEGIDSLPEPGDPYYFYGEAADYKRLVAER